MKFRAEDACKDRTLTLNEVILRLAKLVLVTMVLRNSDRKIYRVQRKIDHGIVPVT